MKPHFNKLSILLALTAILTLSLIPLHPAAALQFDSEIIIQPDGTVQGTDKFTQTGNTYTLTADLTGSPENGACFIAIRKDNIVIDGSGYTISGENTGVAISLYGRTNVVVKNFVIKNFAVGIELGTDYNHETQVDTYSTNNQILNNRITTVYDGITLQAAHNNIIKDNTITSPTRSYCIDIRISNGNTVANNKLFSGGIGLYNQTQTIFQGNTLDDKPIVILEGASNQVIDGAGQVLLFGCNDITVKDVSPTIDSKVAVGFYSTNNSQIANCKGNIVLENSHHNTITQNQLTSTIKLFLSHNNNIIQNTITSNKDYGINLEYSLNNTIQANTISAAGKIGIGFVGAHGNYIHGNLISACKYGIELTYNHFTSNIPANIAASCTNNFLSANNITGCSIGIYLNGADGNFVFANNIADCIESGVKIYISDGNAFYHNNFLSNTQDVYEDHSYFDRGHGQFITYYSANNTWDDGYHSGGNYWSGYTGTDGNGDGIGDTAHTAFENHTDNYPLMQPFTLTSTDLTQPPLEESSSPQSKVPAGGSPDIGQDQAIPIIAAAVAVIVIAGLLIYFRKRLPQRSTNLLSSK